MASILAYAADGMIVASLDLLRAAADDGTGTLVDPLAYEAAGGRLRDLWLVPGAIGSGAWPEHLGAGLSRYRAEIAGGRIVRLVHADTGQVRDREQIIAAAAAAPDPAALLGTPMRPIDAR